MALGRVFLRVLRFFLISIIPPMLSSSARCSYHKDRQAMPGNLQKCNALPDIERTALLSVHAPSRHVKLLGAWEPQRVR